MKLFLVTFVIMLTVIAMMSIGYIVQRKKIKGSCGGISDLGLEKVCDCDEPCDKRKELMRKMEVERKLEQKLMAQQIDIKTLEN